MRGACYRPARAGRIPPVRARGPLLLLPLLWLLGPVPAPAQEPLPVSVEVRDALDDHPLPGARVRASQGTADEARATTDAQGRAALHLAPGVWQVSVEAEGYLPLEGARLEVRPSGQQQAGQQRAGQQLVLALTPGLEGSTSAPAPPGGRGWGWGWRWGWWLGAVALAALLVAGLGAGHALLGLYRERARLAPARRIAARLDGKLERPWVVVQRAGRRVTLQPEAFSPRRRVQLRYDAAWVRSPPPLAQCMVTPAPEGGFSLGHAGGYQPGLVHHPRVTAGLAALFALPGPRQLTFWAGGLALHTAHEPADLDPERVAALLDAVLRLAEAAEQAADEVPVRATEE